MPCSRVRKCHQLQRGDGPAWNCGTVELGGVSKLRPCCMVLGAYASLNPGSLDQVQEDHTVLKMRMKVGPMDGKEMLDCTFRPLLLRGEAAAGQVSPHVLQLSSSSVPVYSFSARALQLSSSSVPVYRGTSLTRKRTPLGPYRRPMPRILGGS